MEAYKSLRQLKLNTIIHAEKEEKCLENTPGEREISGKG